MNYSNLDRSYFYVSEGDGVQALYFSFFNDIEPISKWDYVETGILATLTLCSCLENIFFIILLSYHKSLHTATNILVINVAAVSLLLTPMSVLICVANLSGQWTTGEFSCKFTIYSILQTSIVLIWTMAAIACDRYRKIVTPMKKQLRARSAGFIAVVLWLCGAIIIFPSAISQLTLTVQVEEESYDICTRTTDTFSVASPAVALVVGFFLPLIIILVSYHKVTSKLTHMKAQLGRFKDTSLKSKGGEQKLIKKETRQYTRHKRVTRTLISIVVIFLVMWSPDVTLLGFIIIDMRIQNLWLKGQYCLIGVCFLNLCAAITPLFYCISDSNVKECILRLVRKEAHASPDAVTAGGTQVSPHTAI